MRHLSRSKFAQMGMIGAAVGLLITLSISILVYYNVVSSIDVDTIDVSLGATKDANGTINGSRPALNATNSVNSQATTCFTIAPIVAIVIVAVVVIGYVQKIGG